MKKISPVLLVLFSCASFAQTYTPSSSLASQANPSIKTYSYSDSSGTNSIISPAPGVYIQPPAWVRNLNNQAAQNNQRNNQVNLNTQNSNMDKISNADKAAAAQKETEAAAALAQKNLAQPLISNTAQTQAVGKVQGQVVIPNRDIATNDIAVWNKTTQQRDEAQGKAKFAQQYQEFLSHK